jgi:hypothetical protein
MGDDWDFDFLPSGLGYTDLADPQQMQEPDQVCVCCMHVCACIRSEGGCVPSPPRPRPHTKKQPPVPPPPAYMNRSIDGSIDRTDQPANTHSLNSAPPSLHSPTHQSTIPHPPGPAGPVVRDGAPRALRRVAPLLPRAVRRCLFTINIHAPRHPRLNSQTTPLSLDANVDRTAPLPHSAGSLGGRRLSGKPRRCSNQGPAAATAATAAARRGSSVGGAGNKENQQGLMGPPRKYCCGWV